MAPRLRPHSWLATEGPSTRWQPSLTLNNQSSVHSRETSGTMNGQGLADLIPSLVSENSIFFYRDVGRQLWRVWAELATS